MKNTTISALLAISGLLIANTEAGAETYSYKSGFNNDRTFAGPMSPQAELEEADRVKTPLFTYPSIDEALAPLFETKAKIYKETGFQMGFFYTTLFQTTNDEVSGKEDFASAGILRFNGKWDAYDRNGSNPGSFVFNVDHRHKLGSDIAPNSMGDTVGHIGHTGVPFSDVGLELVDAHWQQKFKGGETGLAIGRYDPNDYINAFGASNIWTGFQNLYITNNTSIALPDSSYGVGVGHWVNDNFFALANISDANGTLTNLDFFDGGSEFFSAVELGWAASKDQRYTNAVQLTAWHVDQRVGAGVGEADGLAVNGIWLFENNLMPFIRFGFSDGSAPINNESLTVGAQYFLTSRSDSIGIAYGWGDPASAALKEQSVLEAYYKLQLAQNLAITPSIQYLHDPATNGSADDAMIFGLRVRASF